MNKWTDEQLPPIEHRSGTMLLSAAAGSGKTAVLVERVIRYIIEDGCDITDLLIVTFTQASASQMREKIIYAIKEKIKLGKQNKHLESQLIGAYNAKITTVHAFCMDIVRQYAHKLNIKNNFTIGDPNTCSQMLESCLCDVLEEFYKENSTEFEHLCSFLSNGKDDKKLSLLVLDTYKKIQGHPFPIKKLNEYLASHSDFASVDDSVFSKILKSKALDMLEFAIKNLYFAVSQMKSIHDVFNKYYPAFFDDIATCENLISTITTGTWDEIYQYVFTIEHKKLQQMRNFTDVIFLSEIKNYRENYKKIVKEIRENIFNLPTREIEQDILQNQLLVRSLTSIVDRLTSVYSHRKRKQNILDFNDLEHFAVQLLTSFNKDGNICPSEIAKNLNFTEIMIDEYQDTNDIQELIFKCVSNQENNLFMVGDVKQSIYKFRLSNPSIFLKKYETYPIFTKDSNVKSQKMIMSKNFRSSADILNTVNFLFSNLMSRDFGSIDYDGDQYLYEGIKREYTGDYNCEIFLIDCDANSNNDDQETPERIKIECDFVAKKILDMFKSGFKIFDKTKGKFRECNLSDFAILLRSPSGKLSYFKRSLNNLGIGVDSDDDDNLFNYSEILSICSLLEIIDNPYNDIALIGVMRSPVYSFSEDELCDIRANHFDVSFYECVFKKSLEENKKCEAFIKEIAAFRSTAVRCKIFFLIDEIYQSKNFFSIYGSMPDGSLRTKRLVEFLEIARNFESNETNRLFAFVQYIKNTYNSDQGLKIKTSNANHDCVKILSIHKSKGLEYPIVLLCDLTKKFNRDDLKSTALIHPELGIAFKNRDLVRKIEYCSLIRNCLNSVCEKDMLEEELRILYVALTRARDKLIIVGSYKNLENSLVKIKNLLLSSKLNPHYLQTLSSYSDLILSVVLNDAQAQKIIDSDRHIDFITDNQNIITINKAKPLSSRISDDIKLPSPDRTKRKPSLLKLSFPEYPFREMCTVPSKLTVTEINNINNTSVSRKIKLSVPDFSKDVRGLTPSDRGIAHHLFMQLCDFDSIFDVKSIEIQLNLLASRHLLSKEQCLCIDPINILGFFKSPIFTRLKKSDKVMREFKFSILSDKFYNTSCKTDIRDRILLQGVIDCMFFESGQIVLIDFKTDNVTFKNQNVRAHEHGDQLKIYQYAAEEIFGLRVKESIIYFFNTADTIIIK